VHLPLVVSRDLDLDPPPVDQAPQLPRSLLEHQLPEDLDRSSHAPELPDLDSADRLPLRWHCRPRTQRRAPTLPHRASAAAPLRQCPPAALPERSRPGASLHRARADSGQRPDRLHLRQRQGLLAPPRRRYRRQEGRCARVLRELTVLDREERAPAGRRPLAGRVR
jgi:hypothetical protein